MKFLKWHRDPLSGNWRKSGQKKQKSHYQPQGSEPGSGAAFVRPQCE